jgi:hypothetical protein
MAGNLGFIVGSVSRLTSAHSGEDLHITKSTQHFLDYNLRATSGMLDRKL